MSTTAKSKIASKNDEEMITVKLPKDRSSNADPRGVYVSVNGIAMFVPRGKEVTIPKSYYEVLLNSMEAEDEADEYIASEESKKQLISKSKGRCWQASRLPFFSAEAIL